MLNEQSPEYKQYAEAAYADRIARGRLARAAELARAAAARWRESREAWLKSLPDGYGVVGLACAWDTFVLSEAGEIVPYLHAFSVVEAAGELAQVARLSGRPSRMEFNGRWLVAHPGEAWPSAVERWQASEGSQIEGMEHE